MDSKNVRKTIFSLDTGSFWFIELKTQPLYFGKQWLTQSHTFITSAAFYSAFISPHMLFSLALVL